VTPLSGLLFAAATGALAGMPQPEFALDVAVTVVLASEGYPALPVTGRTIAGLEAAASVPEVQILHAATALQSQTGDATSSWTTERLVATGGRVLNVVALGTTFAEARARAYEALGRIHLDGGQYRTDIAQRVAD
jgi:phosphoribosylamine--glycine ligase